MTSCVATGSSDDLTALPERLLIATVRTLLVGVHLVRRPLRLSAVATTQVHVAEAVAQRLHPVAGVVWLLAVRHVRRSVRLHLIVILRLSRTEWSGVGLQGSLRRVEVVSVVVLRDRWRWEVLTLTIGVVRDRAGSDAAGRAHVLIRR